MAAPRLTESPRVGLAPVIRLHDPNSPQATALRMLREARNCLPRLQGRDQVVECARYRHAASYAVDGNWSMVVAVLSGAAQLGHVPERGKVIRFPGPTPEDEMSSEQRRCAAAPTEPGWTLT